MVSANRASLKVSCAAQVWRRGRPGRLQIRQGAAGSEEIVNGLGGRAVSLGRHDQVVAPLHTFGLQPAAEPNHGPEHIPVESGVGVVADRHDPALDWYVFRSPRVPKVRAPVEDAGQCDDA